MSNELVNRILPESAYSGDHYKQKLTKYGNYHPPEQFRHGEEHMVARFKKDPPGGDGQEVLIWEQRWPATFWQLVILESKDSKGEILHGASIFTGSGPGIETLVFEIAKAVSEGMLEIIPDKAEK